MTLKFRTFHSTVMLLIVQLVCQGQAAPPANWEVIRIFVREDEVGTLVPQDYSPVEIEDLSAALKREEERRSQLLLNSPHIAEAVYVAQCTMEHLSSSQSRWQVVSQQTGASMTLGELSCALKGAAVVPAEDQSLINNLRSSVDGQTTLLGINSNSNYWFGFSCSSTKLSNERSTFEIRMPSATLGRMLIAAPEGLQLSSPDVVIRKISDPGNQLPNDWPTSISTENVTWYLLHTSGLASFRINTESIEKKDVFSFQQFVRSARITYDVNSAGLSVAGEFSLERIGTNLPIELRISKALRVKNITVADSSIEWSIDSSMDVDSHVIRLARDERLEKDNVVRVECIGSIEYPFTGALPSMRIERGFAWSGTTNLRIDRDFILEPTAADQFGWFINPALAEPVTSATDASTTREGDTATAILNLPSTQEWTDTWTGVPPKTEVSISRVEHPWKVSSLTRVLLQPNWIAATAHLQLTAKQLKSNVLRLQLGEGWLIDGLTIEPTEVPVNYQLPDGGSGEIVLNWGKVSKEIAISLRVAAHRSQNTDVDRLSIQAPRVVSVPGAEQEDIYAIEQVGQFRIQSDPQVQRMLLRSSDLPAWQLAVLTQSDVVLLRGTRGNIPATVFKRSSGRYTSRIQMIATPESGKLRVQYSVEVQPVAGAIDRVACLLSLPQDAAVPTWNLLRDDDSLPLQTTQSVAPNYRFEHDNSIAGGETLYQIQLPESTAEKFVLRSEVTLPINPENIASLPLLSTTGAVSTDAILALPRRFSLMNSSVGIESLPGSICCSTGELSTKLGTLGASMVAYRYDPSAVSTVDLQALDSDSNVRSWVWSDQIDHWLYNDGLTSHTCEWQIFAPESGECTIELPIGWRLDRLLFDGEPIEISRQSQPQKISITLPRSERIQLKLYCVSYGQSPSWLSKVELLRPKISLDSFHSRELLWLQPSKLAIGDLLTTTRPITPSDLLPSSWWHWLAPDFIRRKTIDSPMATREELPQQARLWHAVEITSPGKGMVTANDVLSEIAPSVRLIDRASLNGICIAILFAGAGLSMLLLGRRTWTWWLAISLAVVATVLSPSYYAIIGHLALLCLVCGACARFVGTIVNSRSASISTSSQRGSTLQRKSATIAMCLILLNSGTAIQGQTASNDAPVENEAAVFGVIIPINKQGEFSAKHVYAPRNLMDLLENPDSESLSQSPEILGAKYILKLRGGTSLTTSYVQEFTAEFEVQFDTSDTELQLPFLANQVQLLRGFVFGQEVYIGSRLKQSPDSITYFPDEPGRVRMRLQLIPKQYEVEDRTAIEITIPKIATAALEILTDDSLDVKIVGKGEVRRVTPSSWEAEIGPVDTLKVNWPTRPLRTPMPNLSQVYADTWLQIQDEQLMADCHLRIEGAASLPKQLHLIADAGWEPVGSQWKDVQMLSSELVTIGNRRIYTVTRSEQSDATLVRVLMVPRNLEAATTFNIPFFSLQENSLASRTLAVATTKIPGWKLVGAEAWSRLPSGPSELLWDSSKLAQQPTILRVPAGAVSATLQRTAEQTSVLVAESNVVTFLNSESSISYRAVWAQSNSNRPVLKLQIPSGTNVKTVQINGAEADFQVISRAGKQLLVVRVDNARGLQQLDIKLSLHTGIGKSELLPRIVLDDTPVVSSDYQVRCGAELSCRFSSEQDGGLTLPKPTTSPSEMLSNRASGMGRVELGNKFRESAQLPIHYELAKRAAVKVEECVMMIARTEQGWKATVEAWVSGDGEPVEFVFFEIPSSLRELIESGGLPFSTTNSVSPSRATLCIIPKPAVDGKTRVAFDFRLPTVGSSQSISIPDIQLLVASPSRPILALPHRIDNQLVRWSRAGRRLNDDWLIDSNIKLARGEFIFFQLGENQLQTSWTPATLDSKRPKVLYAMASVDDQLNQSFAGVIDYWVDPQNRLELVAHLPAECELVGIQAGGSSAVWRTVASDDSQQVETSQSNAPRELRILMQPNYLPVHLRFFVRWNRSEHSASSDEQDLLLPTLEAAGLKKLNVSISSRQSVRGVWLSVAPRKELSPVIPATTEARSLRSQLVAVDIAEHWKNLLLESLPTVSDLKNDELRSWLQNWNPQVVGLRGDLLLRSNQEITPGMQSRNYENVIEFWDWYLKQVDTGGDELVGSLGPLASQSDTTSYVGIHTRFQGAQSTNSGGRELRWYAIDLPVAIPGNSVKLGITRVRNYQLQNHQVTAAGLILLASGLAFWLTRRLRSVAFLLLSARPWVYWAFLAVLAWIVLPIAWPSLIIALSALSLFVSQFANSRRRNYSGRAA